ncbi:unnamed protein product [Rhodiola kirilowii]
MSGSMLRRITPFVASRIRQNQRLLTTSVLHVVEPSSTPSTEAIQMTDNCVRRIKELQNDASSEGKVLRLGVETGGCSGFQYTFELDSKTDLDDRIFEKDGVKLVVDKISYDFVKGATVDFVEELIRSAFVVAVNPSAVGGCSCKSSFMVKQ